MAVQHASLARTTDGMTIWFKSSLYEREDP